MTQSSKTLQVNFSDFCRKDVAPHELYVRAEKETITKETLITRVYERGPRSRSDRQYPKTQRVYKGEKIERPKYKPLDFSFREHCNSLAEKEEKVKDGLRTEIQDRNIGLSVGIPATAVVAAVGGNFAPSILKALKVLLKIN